MSTLAISDSTLGRPTTRADYSARNFPDIASALESRRTAKLNTVSGSEFGAQERIRYYVPQGTHEVLDGPNSYMRFRVRDVTPVGGVVLEPHGASAFFDRITLRNNGIVLEDVQYANWLGAVNVKASEPSYNSSIGQASGTYTPNTLFVNQTHDSIWQRNRTHLTGAYEYIYPLAEVCLLNHELYLPLMYMGNSGIAIDAEFILAKAEAIMCNKATGATAPAYKIIDCELILELVNMRQDWVTQGWAHLAEGRNIELPLVCWEVIRQTALTNTLVEVIRFSNFNQSVKAIFAIFREQSVTESLSEETKIYSWDFPNLKDAQFRINVDLKPEQAIVATDGTYQYGNNRIMVEVFKALRQYKDYERGNCFHWWSAKRGSIAAQTNPANSDGIHGTDGDFMLGLPLDTHILGDRDNLLSGLNLRERAAPIELQLNKTASHNTMNVYLLLQYDAKLVINRGEVATYK